MAVPGIGLEVQGLLQNQEREDNWASTVVFITVEYQQAYSRILNMIKYGETGTVIRGILGEKMSFLDNIETRITQTYNKSFNFRYSFTKKILLY